MWEGLQDSRVSSRVERRKNNDFEREKGTLRLSMTAHDARTATCERQTESERDRKRFRCVRLSTFDRFQISPVRAFLSTAALAVTHRVCSVTQQR